MKSCKFMQIFKSFVCFELFKNIVYLHQTHKFHVKVLSFLVMNEDIVIKERHLNLV